MKKKYNGLVNIIDNYKKEIEAVDERRKTWNETTKQNLAKYLEDLKQEFELSCSIVEDEHIVNLEFTYLSFLDQKTKIRLQEKEESIVQYGGGLLYYQNFNGKIGVRIIMPYIDNIKGKKGDHVDLETVTPEHLDEILVLNHAVQFFEALYDWQCFHPQEYSFVDNPVEELV